MNNEPESTLLWAEFLWRVVKEAPGVVFSYLVLLDHIRRRKAEPIKQGRHYRLELSDSVKVSDGLTGAIVRLQPSGISIRARLNLTTGQPS